MKKIKLVYPPGGLFQRGEDRCQCNVDASTACAVRACNDLGYIAAVLKGKYDVELKDYQGKNLDEFHAGDTDVLFLSTTNATIFKDLEMVNKVKRPGLVVILKGAIFFNPADEMLAQLDLTNVDYLIGGEAEFIIDKLLDAHFLGGDMPPGVLYKYDGKWVKTDFNIWFDDLDSLPFPARDLMENGLYVRPDTGETQATITTSRGCGADCIFCLTPVISGKKLRLRSAQNVFDEILDCYKNFGIKNFFFKSDTFTMNKPWVMELCDLIIDSKLKIQWAANSRVNPIDLETLEKMKRAGCYLVAFGFESGSQNSLDKMKKGTSAAQNLQAAKLAKQAGLLVYGFYMIGFPWERADDLAATKKLMFEIDADFIELHIATPFYGTQLAKMFPADTFGKDYFKEPAAATEYLTTEELTRFRKKTILKYHLRPSFILKKLFNANPKVLRNYFDYGIRLLKNCL